MSTDDIVLALYIMTISFVFLMALHIRSISKLTKTVRMLDPEYKPKYKADETKTLTGKLKDKLKKLFLEEDEKEQ